MYFRTTAVNVRAQGTGSSDGPGGAGRFSRSFATVKKTSKWKVVIMLSGETGAYCGETAMGASTYSDAVPGGSTG